MLPTPQRAVTIRQYRVPGGHEEIGATTSELAEVDTVRPAEPIHLPVWPDWKPDGSWWMTADCRELNKVVPPMHAACLQSMT